GLFDMVGACRGKQQRFGPRPPAGRVAGKQQLANRFGPGAAARFSCDNDVDPAGFQCLGERAELRRLADPLPAFEADEFPAFAHAMPMSDLSPSQMRPKKPALPTSSPATNG